MNDKNKQSTSKPMSHIDDCKNSYTSSIVNNTEMKSPAKKQSSKAKNSNHSSNHSNTTDCK